jgi:hypothetical protein
MEQFGKIFVVTGIIIILVGLIVWFFGDKLTWFGNLQGDVKIEKGKFRFYAPITSMLLISIVISVIVFLIRKYWQ